MSDFDPKAIAAKVARELAKPGDAGTVEKRIQRLANQSTELPELDDATAMLIPDVAGTVQGWRAWGILPELPPDGIPLLQSVTFGHYIWKPRQVQTATCRKDPTHVPGEHCSCGNYSAKDLDHLMSMKYHLYDAEDKGMFHVIGEVANWGKVVEGTQGWRAEHSYPRTLYVPFEAWSLAVPLQTAYGVKVQFKNFLGASVLAPEEAL